MVQSYPEGGQKVPRAFLRKSDVFLKKSNNLVVGVPILDGPSVQTRFLQELRWNLLLLVHHISY